VCGRLGVLDTGLSFALPLSAEHAGRIDHAGGREQPEGDQNQLHDLTPLGSQSVYLSVC
jgi:hypothetical protein